MSDTDIFAGLAAAQTRDKLFEAAEAMTTSKGRPVRGGWTDGNLVYGWVLVNDDDPENPHWAPYVWDRLGKEIRDTEHHARIERLLTREP